MILFLPVLIVIPLMILRKDKLLKTVERKSLLRFVFLILLLCILVYFMRYFLQAEGAECTDLLRGWLILLAVLELILLFSFLIFCFCSEKQQRGWNVAGRLWILLSSGSPKEKQAVEKLPFRRRFFSHLLPVSALVYMVFFFAVTEVYFANLNEWIFTYESILPVAILLAVLLVFALCLLLSLALRGKEGTNRLIVLESSVLAAMYLQNLLLNDGNFIIGTRPVHSWIANGINLLVWLLLLTVPQLLLKYAKDPGKIVMGGLLLSGLLLAMQLVPLPMLLLTKREGGAYRPYSEKRLSGEEQYVVSGNRNVVVFILDAYYNGFFDEYLAENEEIKEKLSDFTYYDNVSTKAFYTAFSLPYLMTAADVDFSVSLPESNTEAWQGENSERFYSAMQDLGYKTFLYTDSAEYAGGEGMNGIVSNLTEVQLEVVPRPFFLYGKMLSLSLYRYLPYFMKDPFFLYDSSDVNLCCRYRHGDQMIDAVRSDASYDIATQAALYGVDFFNYDYYGSLKQGLTVVDGENRLIWQHLWGMHNPYYSREGNSMVSDDEEQLICMEIVEGYMDQLKKMGIYDDTCIIITADHGNRAVRESDPVVLIKGFHEHGDSLKINHAPGCLQSDLLPTILDLLGEDPEQIKGGTSLLRLDENEERSREIRVFMLRQDMPSRPKCGGFGASIYNCYEEYRFTGRTKDYDEEKDLVGIYPIYDYWW